MWFLAVTIAVTVAVPRDAQALISLFTGKSSSQILAKCLMRQPTPQVETCRFLARIADPTAAGVTGIEFTIQYDPLRYEFDEANSGPLGVFSVGGDAPPVNPGIGTQPLQLLPDSGYTAGAPLPGSTLTYTNTHGLLTVNYHLASPITVDNEINVFRTDFRFIDPVDIDVALSTVTYHAAGPGGDFSSVSFSCTTTDVSGGCGSNTPSTGETLSLQLVPEPGTLLLVGSALAGLVACRLRRRASV